MRYHIARDVLGVCLTIATAMAQGPAASTTSFGDTTGSRSGNRLAGAFSREEFTLFEDRPSRAERPSLSEALRRREQQGETDYSPLALFRQNHGQFMDRREAYDPSLELRARAYPYQRIGGEPGHFDMIGYDIDVEAPVLLSPDIYMTFGLYQYGRHYTTSSSFGTRNNAGGINDETLTAAGVRLGIGAFLAPNVLLEVETNPGVYSDLESGLHHEDFDFYSSALLTVETMDGFFFKFGARYNQIYRDAPWLPYLGFSWEVVEGFRIDLLAPEKIELSYWPSAGTGFSLGTMVQGAEYHVHTLNGAGKQRTDLQVQEIISYLGMTHRFNDNFSFGCRVGMVVAGDYKFTTGANGFDPADGSLDPGVYADFTFGIDW